MKKRPMASIADSFVRDLDGMECVWPASVQMCREPLTAGRLTDEGRARFSDYLGMLERVLRSARLAGDANLNPRKRTAWHASRR